MVNKPMPEGWLSVAERDEYQRPGLHPVAKYLLAHATAADRLLKERDERILAQRTMLAHAAIELLGYDAAYGGGGVAQALSIAKALGYEGALTSNRVHGWLFDLVGAGAEDTGTQDDQLPDAFVNAARAHLKSEEGR